MAVGRAFAGGESVVVDMGARSVAVDGADASADVAIESDFFALAPGARALWFSGASGISVTFSERWL